jgi:hypothetical protein
MKTYKVFDDYKVARFHCEDETIYKRKELVEGLDELFARPDLDPNLLDQNGKGVSTFRVPGYWLMDVKGIESFYQYLKEKALEVADYFGHTNAKDITIFRCWTNKIWEGCSGNVHDHDPESHVIALFYPLAPGNSADLGFVRDTRNHASNHEILPQNLEWQNVKEGDLLFHETRAWHTVSEHKNKDPRIVFVIELSYIFSQ